MRIYQLPPAVANQIAAGEVIERPASIVKELLENAYDAGASVINIEIGYGGLNHIKISDNGVGILAEDLPLAIAAHATSKIKTLNDLYAIESMGFRGEALASIASVAKLTLISRPAEQEHAMMLRTQGDEISLTPCARAVGTTLEVADIFFNAPVRKRFLKSEKLEFQAIETVIKRFALSAPHCAITVKHNSKLVLSLPAAINEQAKLSRMSKLFGSAFMQDAIVLDVAVGSMRLYGWISGPNFQRSQNDRLWVYINQRMVKDKLINHALKQAYNDLLHPGRFPACLLYFGIDTKEVDVNVHPTKHEVRFTQARLVHDFFTTHITKALNSSQAAVVEVSTPKPSSVAIHEPYMPFTVHQFQKPDSEIPWVFLNSKYILVFIKEQAYVVDVLTLYQNYLANLLSSTELPLASRPLLVPINHTVSCSLEMQQILAQVGMQIEVLTPATVSVRSMPIQLPHLDIRCFLDLCTSTASSVSIHKIFEFLSKAQKFDPRMFSNEERMELNKLLLDSKVPASLCKLLTEEDCRKLLHV